VAQHPQKLGHQLVCDVRGNITEEIDLFLYGAAAISFDNLVEIILKRGGLAIPAHIDRLSNSVLANLGFLPPLAYSAVEVVNLPPTTESNSYPVIRSSDTHFLEDVASRTTLIEATSNDFSGLKEALQKGHITL
jgi:hypothetical protein